MKKVAAASLLLLLLAVGAAWYLLNPGAHRANSKVAECLPRDTVVFLHFQDLRQTRRRFAKTALAEILREPEVARFLEKPQREVAWMKRSAEFLDQVVPLDPREGFLAITGWSETGPEVIAGAELRGSKEIVRKALAQRHGQLEKKWPAGRSDLIRHRDATIEFYGDEAHVEVSAQIGKWWFVANHLETLKQVIDHWGRHAVDAGGSLRDDSLFQNSLAQVPRRYEGAVFVRTNALTSRLQALFSTSGLGASSTLFEQLRQIEAITAMTMIEHRHFRDIIFVAKAGTQTPPPLSSKSLTFVTANTVLYYAANLARTPSDPRGAPAPGGLPDASSGGVVLKSILPTGATLEQFLAAFGPGIGFVVNWPPDNPQPALIFSTDIRDGAKARRLLDSLTQGKPAAESWSKQELGAHSFYVGPARGLAMPVPVLALTDRLLLVGFDLQTVRDAVAKVDSGATGGTPSSTFRTATTSVRRPTGAYGYIDSAAVIDRAYGLVRSLLVIGSSFVSKPSSSVDITKLPPTETLSKHLSPIAFSESSDPAGIRFESVGPVTVAQLAVGAGAAAVGLAPLLPEGLTLSSFGDSLKQNPPAQPPTAPSLPPDPADLPELDKPGEP